MSCTHVGCWDIPNDHADCWDWMGLVTLPSQILQFCPADPQRSFFGGIFFFFKQKILLGLPLWPQEWLIQQNKMLLEHQNGGVHPQ